MIDYTSEDLTTPKIVLKNQLKISCVGGPQGVDKWNATPQTHSLSFSQPQLRLTKIYKQT